MISSTNPPITMVYSWDQDRIKGGKSWVSCCIRVSVDRYKSTGKACNGSLYLATKIGNFQVCACPVLDIVLCFAV